MSSLKLFSISTQPAWASGVAQLLGVPLSPVAIERYALGQFRIQLGEDVRGKNVCILGSTDGDTNITYAELEQLIAAARLSGAASIDVVIPYFGYARSDKEDYPRVPIIARTKADILQVIGTTSLTTVNVHNPAIQGFFSIPVTMLDVTPLLLLALEEIYPKTTKLTFSSPDLKGGELATPYIKHFAGSHLVSIWKKRDARGEARIVDIVGTPKGPTVVVDDEIASGSSMVNAGTALLKKGAKEVVYVATHGIFSDNAWEKLFATKPRAIIVSDTVRFQLPATMPSGISIREVSIAPLITQAIQCMVSSCPLSEFDDVEFWRKWMNEHPEFPLITVHQGDQIA